MEQQSADLPPTAGSRGRDDLEGALKEGDPLPSVGTVAANYQLNPLTVLKGYRSVVDGQEEGNDN